MSNRNGKNMKSQMRKIAKKVFDKNVETKRFTAEVIPRTVLPVGGVLLNMSNIVGGNDQNRRVGHQIEARKLEYKLQLLNNTSTSDMYFRYAVVRRRGKFAPGDVPTTAATMYRPIDLDKWVILEDRIVNLRNDLGGSSAVRGSFNHQRSHKRLAKITYDTGVSGDPEINGLYMWIISENATAGNEPTFGHQFSLTYKDA